MIKCYSHGKLLLTGEYMVLKGAKALAIPTKMGQMLDFQPDDSKTLKWESLDNKNLLWFSASMNIQDFTIKYTNDSNIAKRLVGILKTIRDQNNSFLIQNGGMVKTRLEFDRHWGLGTSSTLISNLAQWSQTNPYTLLTNSFGGSGYDIACATSKSPLIYSIDKTQPHIEACKFDPEFKSNLYFIYLKHKKNSREAIKQFRKQNINQEQITYTTSLTMAASKADTLNEFEKILNEHERLISKILGLVPIKEKQFPDFPGTIKSLGAWGGDFILATGDNSTPDYFKNKGYTVVISYKEMMI